MKKRLLVALMPVILTFYIVNIRQKILGEPLVSPVVENPITIVITPSPTASPSGEVLAISTPSASPTRKPTPTPTKANPTPTPESSQAINNFIDRFAGQYGVNPNVIRHIAVCESGFNTSARNGKYIGLFQYDTVTWKNIRKEMAEDTNPDLRYSAEESVQTTAYVISKGRGRIWPNCEP